MHSARKLKIIETLHVIGTLPALCIVLFCSCGMKCVESSGVHNTLSRLLHALTHNVSRLTSIAMTITKILMASINTLTHFKCQLLETM